MRPDKSKMSTLSTRPTRCLGETLVGVWDDRPCDIRGPVTVTITYTVLHDIRGAIRHIARINRWVAVWHSSEEAQVCAVQPSRPA